ncbi:uncharacterized protein EI97DRAFT_430734 [Westerdykella ornata]|uniref:BZIP domain-containing protein n=1 Tax=Westerdykella ornata TaxID=318751 RepID=A0A6A6JT09_WESOR|nr:uncharacterized protein EI97DRAFT_430734 [Westerdykella ornata]KAF2279702.1 hypothetical protein EI97DRAFT_430734 [Westerdykella ornata]
MSDFPARRGVNVSQYIAQLNTVPSADDTFDSPPNFEEDLALFTNSEFVNWDGGDNFDVAPAPAQGFNMNTFDQPAGTDTQLNLNFNGSFDFDFTSFQHPIVDQQPMPSLQHPQPQAYPIPPNFTTSPTSGNGSPISPGFSDAGKKRKHSHIVEPQQPPSQHSIDEAARLAAEEDKRRRNTAASARFRIKKKQREQQLEKTAKEMSERVSVLETRIQQLETENAWLKGLITEKNGGKASGADVAAMLKKHEESASGDRISSNRNDGVGTKTEGSKA